MIDYTPLYKDDQFYEYEMGLSQTKLFEIKICWRKSEKVIIAFILNNYLFSLFI